METIHLKPIEIFHKANVLFLLIWYVISIPIIYCDNTITGWMLVYFELVSILMINITWRVRNLSYKNPSLFDFFTNISLLVWFLFVTHRDINTDYSLLTKLLYVSVDFSSILFLVDTFLGFLIETKFFKKTGIKVNDNYRYVVSFLCALSFLTYLKFSKVIA